jgi:hypothetical protein
MTHEPSRTPTEQPRAEPDPVVASGLVNTSVQVGGSIGLAVLATLATERTNGRLAHGESTAAALTPGYHLAYLVGAALVAVAGAVLRTRPSAEAVVAHPAYSEAG